MEHFKSYLSMIARRHPLRYIGQALTQKILKYHSKNVQILYRYEFWIDILLISTNLSRYVEWYWTLTCLFGKRFYNYNKYHRIHVFISNLEKKNGTPRKIFHICWSCGLRKSIFECDILLPYGGCDISSCSYRWSDDSSICRT